MGFDDLTTLLWRRKLVFTAVSLLCFAVIAAITFALPKMYEATATVFVTPEGNETLDITQSEQIARTYTAIASNPNVAEEVLPLLDEAITRDELLNKLSFAPVERTQLLQITAEGDSPEEAQNLANTYADVFVDRAADQLGTGRDSAEVQVSDPAVLPEDPSSPNIPLYLGFGLLLSLLIGFLIAIAADRMDRRLRISRDDQTVLDQPVIARIPRVRGIDHSGRGQAPELADALRVLRTNIELSPGAAARTVLVTSAGIGEGKTTVAANLALAIAADGDRVTLIEADLRRPTLPATVADPSRHRGAPGLSRYLAQQVEAADVVIQSNAVNSLRVIPAGAAPPQPGRLLRSPRMRSLIDVVQSTSDWVILDSPPTSVGDDALVLSALAQGVLFVVDPDTTTASAARSGLGQLRTVGAEVLGIAVNGVEVPASPYYPEPRQPVAKRT